jgi:beta-lactamase regulating signal transducer with metallopeptidase domain
VDSLLNWLWQGCVVTIATSAVLRALPTVEARLRYRIWCTALLAVVALPLIPAAWPDAPIEAAAAEGVGPVVSLPTGPWTTTTLLIAVWLLWVALSGGRLVVALLSLRSAKAASQPIPRARETRLRHWVAVRQQGRESRLVVSNKVQSAAVLGLCSPMIGLAPTLLEQLTDAELDRIVIHEWAHVQRRDDLATLVQRLVWVVAGWHPAVWWIDRQLHVEREVACDEMAAAITGSRRAYAACLAKLASIRVMGGDFLPAPGARSSSTVSTRIVRLLENRNVSPRRAVAGILVASAVLSAVAWTVGHLDLFVMATPPSAAGSDLSPIQALSPLSSPGQHETSPRPDGASSSLRSSQARETGPGRHVTGAIRTSVPARKLGAGWTAASVTRVTTETGEPRRGIPIGTIATPSEDAVSLPSNSQVTVATPETSPPLLEATSVASLASLPPPPRSATDAAPPFDVPPSAKPPSGWAASADAGVAIGRGSQRAAVATAGLFSQFGKKIASAF